MPQRLRDYRSGRRTALDEIPDWPGRRDPAATRAASRNAPGLAGSLSERHAHQAWQTARQATTQRAPALAAQGGNTTALVALDFVSRIARHIVNCDRCHRLGIADSATPAAWLLWAMGKQPTTKRIMRPVLAEIGRGLPQNPPTTRRIQPRND